MDILKAPDPRLRQKSATVPLDWLGEQIEERLCVPLRNAMKYYTTALGFSAPQLGIPFRAIYVGESFGAFVVNPEIVETTGIQFSHEGCLSLPHGVTYRIKRPEEIVVVGEDVDRKMVVYRASGKDAWIFCHEIDHLDGIMIDEKGQPY